MIHSLRTKVLLAIISITLVTASSITLVFYFKSARMVEDNYGSNLYSRVEQLGNAFDDGLKEIYYITTQSSCDTRILQYTAEYKQTKDEKVLENIAGLLKEYKRHYTDISSVYLVLPGENIIVTSKDYPVYEKRADLGGFESAVRNSDSAASPVMIDDPLRSSAKLLSFVSQISQENSESDGYIMVNMEERAIYYKYLDNLYDGNDSQAMILNENNEIVSTRNAEKMGKKYEAEKMQVPEQAGVISSKNPSVMGVFYQTAFLEYGFFMIVEKSAILSDLNQLRYFLILFLMLFIIISLIPAYFITKAMYQPLRNLTNTMEKVSTGELDERVEVTAGDEIGSLSREFNSMLDHINELIEQLIKEEMLKKDAELEALQYQITPHFMYNTLNSIKYAALIKGEKELGGLVGDFVELLQASINKMGTFVTLADELHLLKNYIRLQEFRYEGNFTVAYDVEEDAKGCFLPRLLMQPMVENALLHGLDLKRENSRITIRGKVDGETLNLSIEDNGRGMTQEQIQGLLNNKAKKTSGLSGIGVANVKERLELYYGGGSGISYVSGEHGTTVHIFLPAYREQNKYSLGNTV